MPAKNTPLIQPINLSCIVQQSDSRKLHLYEQAYHSPAKPSRREPTGPDGPDSFGYVANPSIPLPRVRPNKILKKEGRVTVLVFQKADSPIAQAFKGLTNAFSAAVLQARLRLTTPGATKEVRLKLSKRSLLPDFEREIGSRWKTKIAL
jgi:hypothetical protein